MEANAINLEEVLPPSAYEKYSQLVTALRRGALSGSYNVARQTSVLLRKVIGQTRWESGAMLIELIRAIGRGLVSAQPVELALGNITRRILYIVRQEYKSILKEQEEERKYSNSGGSSVATNVASLSINTSSGDPGKSMSTTGSLNTILNKNEEVDYTQNMPELRRNVIEGVLELMNELDNLYGPIAEQSQRHIHSGEIILTYGRSRTVAHFLKAANSKKNLSFEVLVAEAAPSMGGHVMAASLAEAEIPTTVINDSAIFAMMVRVNKVILPCHAVMANGGLIANAGTHAVCAAAKLYEVPVVCVTGLYKLSPLYPYDQDTFNVQLSPSGILSFEDADAADKVNVANPRFDYIPPELVDLYVTNFSVVPSLRSGSHQPSYIYRLLNEYYCPEDYAL
eukprot:g11955.t1